MTKRIMDKLADKGRVIVRMENENKDLTIAEWKALLEMKPLDACTTAFYFGVALGAELAAK